MTPTSHTQLFNALDKLGQDLAGIVGPSVARVEEAIEFRGPPLQSGLQFNGIGVNELARWLYESPDVDRAKIEYVWRRCCLLLRTSNRALIASTIQSLYPGLPMASGNTYMDQTINMAQAIKAFSWTLGDLEVSKDECLLFLGGGVRIGLTGQSAEFTPDDYRRYSDRYVPDYRVALSEQYGRPRPAGLKTTAIYRHAARALPNFMPTLSLVFGTAVNAGEIFEGRLTRHFNFSVEAHV